MGVVAIFGGTFNPPHLGHRQILEQINKLEYVDRIIVIPTKKPPHKEADMLADERHRLEMCHIICQGIDKAQVSDLEFKREGKSYTVDTLKELTTAFPNKRFALIMGGDMLMSFDKWKDYRRILTLADIIAFYRQGEDFTEYEESVANLTELGANVHRVFANISDISSTLVRNKLRSGENPSKLIQTEILGYIVKNRLYGLDKIFYRFLKAIRENLDDHRYNHSLCVADEALRLALKYGGDPYNAYVAGLLHDITKNYSVSDHLQFAEKFDIIFSDLEKESVNLWHAITGSVYVNHVLGIDNSEIIGAIRYHTTAKSGMCLLEKLVYLADFTSADRNYSDVDVMRELVNTDINSAMEYSLNFTINKLQSRGLTVHPDTLNALTEIKS